MRRGLKRMGLALGAFIALTGCEQESPPATALEPSPPEAFPETTLPPPPHTEHVGTGTVIGIDEQMGKITIALDPVETLRWTMKRESFSIDHSLLNRIKNGDTVTFTLVESNGKYVIQDIRRQ